MRLLHSRRALIFFGLLLLLFSWVASRQTADATAFSLRAVTDVVLVEPFCGQQITWDLPDSRVASLASSAEPAEVNAAGAATVELRGGARASVERLVSGEWYLRIGQGPLSGTCQSPPAALPFSLTIDDELYPDRANGFVLIVGKAGAAGKEPASDTGITLLLAGRVVVGEKVQHGGGWGKASAPTLRKGDIQARIKDKFTQRSITIFEEKLDAGSRVDTHACLDQSKAADLTECLQRSAVRATGFVRENREEGLDVQVHVTTDRIGIEPHGGYQRAVAVTWWSALITSPLVQMLAASLVLFGAVLQNINSFADWTKTRDGLKG